MCWQGIEVFSPRPLKIYQHSGASYFKKNVSFNQIGYGMCRNTFNKENTAELHHFSLTYSYKNEVKNCYHFYTAVRKCQSKKISQQQLQDSLYFYDNKLRTFCKQQNYFFIYFITLYIYVFHICELNNIYIM